MGILQGSRRSIVDAARAPDTYGREEANVAYDETAVTSHCYGRVFWRIAVRPDAVTVIRSAVGVRVTTRDASGTAGLADARCSLATPCPASVAGVAGLPFLLAPLA